jgi:hypothetical protein
MAIEDDPSGLQGPMARICPAFRHGVPPGNCHFQLQTLPNALAVAARRADIAAAGRQRAGAPPAVRLSRRYR